MFIHPFRPPDNVRFNLYISMHISGRRMPLTVVVSVINISMN